MNVADKTPRGKAVMKKLFYGNEYYDVIQKICPACLRKELERMHIDLGSYEQEVEDYRKYAEEHSHEN